MSQGPRANGDGSSGDGSSEDGAVPEEEYKQYHVKKIEVDLHVPSDWVGLGDIHVATVSPKPCLLVAPRIVDVRYVRRRRTRIERATREHF